ncbi:MAG: SDR family NAD(P)-dependent oxidoreductase [Candidatus Poseidonia sp.]|nr:SDR family NAD(P)-dependent oxidoreductase [Poseidonia sp.]
MTSTYLVTGASKGIGRALSIQLSQAGYRVILLARPSKSLDDALEKVQEYEASSFEVACDLGNASSIEQAVSEIQSRCSSLEGLIHNAGSIAPIKPLLEADGHDWARSMQVNLVGVQQLTSGLTPLLVGENRVRVSTISSGASLRPLGSWSAYCTAKAGLDMWARCLALEGAEHHISAIAVAPGIVDTGMQQDIRSAKPEDFPLRDTFVAYHRDGELTDPNDVATRLLPILTQHTMEQSGQRFDIRDFTQS